MKHILLVSFTLLSIGSAQAQLYKSVGPDGKVTYSDTPPAAAAKVEVKSLAGNGGIETNNLPFEIAEAVKSNPVTVFTTQNCSGCDEGRKLLNARGIPFTEKTVSNNSEDVDAFKRAGGTRTLPLLKAGRSKKEGFEEGAWNSLLTTAGYPESNKLPKSYRNPPVQSAAPAKSTNGSKDASAQAPSPTNSGALPEPIGNAPPGFRF